jgi:hypothetical protein
LLKHKFQTQFSLQQQNFPKWLFLRRRFSLNLSPEQNILLTQVRVNVLAEKEHNVSFMSAAVLSGGMFLYISPPSFPTSHIITLERNVIFRTKMNIQEGKSKSR